MLSLSLGCGSGRPPAPVVEQRPEATWEPVQAPPERDLSAMLIERPAPTATLRVPAAPLDVISEAGSLAVYAANGTVTLFEERAGAVVLATTPSLPPVCRPADFAFDRRGRVCALTRCMMSAPCTRLGAQGWTEQPELRGALGLSSARGAIVAWFRQAEGIEVRASSDGGTTFGRVTELQSRGHVVSASAETPDSLLYAVLDGSMLAVQSGAPGTGEGGGTLAAGPRVDSHLSRPVLANGLAGVAAIRGGTLDFSWANATSQATHVEHSIELAAAASAVAAWDRDTLVAAVGRSLVSLDLVGPEPGRQGRWIRVDDRLPEGTLVTGLGRVGSALVVVGSDGTTFVFR
jgi:hypothetical protein